MSGGAFAIPDQSLTSRQIALIKSQVDIITDESTTSTSYANLTTIGPAITLSPGVTQTHLLTVASWIYVTNAGNAAYASVAIAGATASDADAAVAQWLIASSGKVANPIVAATQPSGSTHTMKYRATAFTADFLIRRLTGVAI